MTTEDEFFRKAATSSKNLPPAFHQAAEQSNMTRDVSEIRKRVEFIANVVLAWVVFTILAALIIVLRHGGQI